MSSILILIPSFDNKHIINVIVYLGFDVYAQFQRRQKTRCAVYKKLGQNIFY